MRCSPSQHDRVPPTVLLPPLRALDGCPVYFVSPGQLQRLSKSDSSCLPPKNPLTTLIDWKTWARGSSARNVFLTAGPQDERTGRWFWRTWTLTSACSAHVGDDDRHIDDHGTHEATCFADVHAVVPYPAAPPDPSAFVRNPHSLHRNGCFRGIDKSDNSRPNARTGKCCHFTSCLLALFVIFPGYQCRLVDMSCAYLICAGTSRERGVLTQFGRPWRTL